jgi:organic hydroperoxide reductase OsmC/OhrA
MTTLKTHRFQSAVHWSGDHLVHVAATGRPELVVAASPEFRGGLEGEWSPEDLLVASVASSYAITLSALAATHGVPLHGLEVVAAGDATRRVEGMLGFTVIELEVHVETDRAHEDSARTIAELAEEGCLVAACLATPVRVVAEIHTR